MKITHSHVLRMALMGLLFVTTQGTVHSQEMDGPAGPVEIYPDLCPIKADLYTNSHWYKSPDTTYIRFTTAIANVGPWELRLEPNGPVDTLTGKRPARQVVGWVGEPGDTTVKWYSAGEFEFHTEHNHIHLGKIAQNSIRVYVNDTVAGTSLVFGTKIGFCMVDDALYEPDACCGPAPPGVPSSMVFASCPYVINLEFSEGISKGWHDTYHYTYHEQWVDISSITVSGKFFLQTVVDPDHFLKQTKRSNDTVKIPVFLVRKDAFEPNDSIAAVNAMPVGGAFSSNLGPCRSTIDNLSIHRAYVTTIPIATVLPDQDYFKINLASNAGLSHFVAIRFSDLTNTPFKDGNLELELRNASDGLERWSYSTNDDDSINLNGLAQGTYYIRVVGNGIEEQADSHYRYKLELSLPAVPPPQCGDVNGDGQVNSMDIAILTNCCAALCIGQVCAGQSDFNCDGNVNCADRDILIAHVFQGGPLSCTCP